MRFPVRTQNLTDDDKKLLVEFYGAYSTRQWFDKAEIYDHPNQMKKTLELSCQYNPLLEMKDILSFTQRYNLALEIVDMSHNDKATV